MDKFNDIEFLQQLLVYATANNKLTKVKNDKELDNFKTEQETKRDEFITDLLMEYVNSCKDKFQFKKIYKEKLFKVCIFSISALILLMIVICILLVCRRDGLDLIIPFISTCVTFIGSFIGILKIIVKYIFPENDEKYITEIVQLIQNNDLANKKENLNFLFQNKFVKTENTLSNIEGKDNEIKK